MKFVHYVNGWKYPFVLPHLILYNFIDEKCKKDIREDIKEMNKRYGFQRSLAYYLIFYKPYRNLFYYRVGGIWAFALNFVLPEYKSFYIRCSDGFGGGAFVLNHPYGTIINAKEIGRNFTICQLTTIGNKEHGHNNLIPTIGDNVSLGANVTIIGDIKIGNNVIVGAGSVVVKNVPNNCVVAGNPAKIIRKI